MENTTVRIGVDRYNCLQMADDCFARGDYAGCGRHIDNFLSKIDEKNEAGKKIKAEFDHLSKIREEQIKELHKVTETMRYLEQRDTRDRYRNEIEVSALLDKKSICWSVSLELGLFND